MLCTGQDGTLGAPPQPVFSPSFVHKQGQQVRRDLTIQEGSESIRNAGTEVNGSQNPGPV